jgi:ribosomal protein S12 methylthiotransferase
MTVEQFDPSTSNSAQSQTTTLDIPAKMIEEQDQAVVIESKESNRAAKIGFVSLGLPTKLVNLQ